MEELTVSDDFLIEDVYDDDEDDSIVQQSPRVEEVYVCKLGHETIITLSTDAEVPPTWPCVSCSQPAKLRNVDEAASVKDDDTAEESHVWDRLLTRRSVKEMEKKLNEHLKKLENGEISRVFTI
jgi:hypothetical protein